MSKKIFNAFNTQKTKHLSLQPIKARVYNLQTKDYSTSQFLTQQFLLLLVLVGVYIWHTHP